MNRDIAKSIVDFGKKYSSQQFVSKSQLRNFYQSTTPDMTEQTFRRILYALEKKNMIVSTGRGMYACFPEHSSNTRNKRAFSPNTSDKTKEINNEIKENFPYIDFLIWETSSLHDLMLHQPVQNQIILETEKVGKEPLFNHLSEIYAGQIFLDPDRVTIERYSIQQSESVFISKLISQTPRGKNFGGVPYARLEKILVDILVDSDKFFIYQGQELVNIFENAFAQFWIDERSLIRYAGRRTAVAKLKQFIQGQTRIEFKLINEDTK
jgi:hypothetical protein